MASNATNATGQPDTQMPLSLCLPVMTSCVVGTVSNIFVCYLILAVPRLKTTTNVFVFSTCVCNMLFAILLLPGHCLFSQHLFTEYTTTITILIYISNLSAVSYDRLISITKPMLYMIILTKQRAIYIVIAMWVIPIIYGLLPLIWNSDQKSMVHKVFQGCTLVIFLLSPLFFIVFVYIKVCIEMKKMHRFKKRSLTPSGTFQYKEEPSRKPSRMQQVRQLSSVILRNIPGGDRWNDGEYCSDIQKVRGDSREKFKRSSTKMTLASLEDKSLSPKSRLINGETSPLNSNKLLNNNYTESECRHSVSFSMENLSPDLTGEVGLNPVGETNGISHNGSGNLPIDRDRLSSPYSSPKRNSSISKMKRKAYEIKASLAFLIVALTYMFTWVPVIVITFFFVLDEEKKIPPSFPIFSVYAIALNALADPFLYGLLLPNFRKTLKIMLRRLTTRLK